MESRVTTDECESLEPLLAPYVEGTLDGVDRARVDAHLALCPPCDDTVRAGRVMRQVLRAHVARLHEEAPQGLRRRLTAPRVVAFPALPVARAVRRWAPLAAAAALVMAVVGYGTFGNNGTVLAAQLTLDHLKCLVLADRSHSAEPHALAEHWRQERGWSIEVPPGDAALDLRLVALRRCLYGDGEMAHLVYELGNRSVSLFILPKWRQSTPVLEIMGYDTVTWHRGDRTYAVVGQVSPDEATRLAAYFEARAR
jgi:anti-sigma factor RsiW